MTPQPSFDIARTALLPMDCQAGIVSVYAKPPEEFVARAAAVLRAARPAGMTLIHVQVGFRPGLPEVSERNKLFGAVKSNPLHQKFFEGASGAIHPALCPEPGDLVIIDTLVLFGIATSGVVLSTLLEACDADYRLFVISDCCADTDAALHDALIQRFFPSRGEVIPSQTFIESLNL